MALDGERDERRLDRVVHRQLARAVCNTRTLLDETPTSPLTVKSAASVLESRVPVPDTPPITTATSLDRSKRGLVIGGSLIERVFAVERGSWQGTGGVNPSGPTDTDQHKS